MNPSCGRRGRKGKEALVDKATEAPALLEVEGLRVYFESGGGWLGRKRNVVKAVEDVSFRMQRGTTVGLVGESGSGKSTIGKAITRIIQPSDGVIRYEGTPISGLSERAFFPYRKKIQIIFQDPYNSLDPRMTIGGIIEEPLKIHFPRMTSEERRRRVGDLLDRVGLHSAYANRYPHQFSGGQRQRISIARALSVEPELIICDESVSALDVSVQAQIVNLLMDLQEALELTYLFIAHDLAVVSFVSDEVLVMENGVLKEQGSAESIYRNPQDPYTRKLLEAVPKMPTLSGRTNASSGGE